MRLTLVYLLLTSPLLGQISRPVPQQAPIDALIQSYQSALNNGKYNEAALKRDQARALLSQIPATDPQFVNWAQRISQIYDTGGFALQARGVLQDALNRSGAAGDALAGRLALLSAIAYSWQEDRNLLQAVNYLEQAAVAAESAPQPTAAVAQGTAGAIFSAISGIQTVFTFPQAAENGWIYQRLFTLYKTLGRPQDAAAVLTRVVAHVKNNDQLLASLYQQQGQIDEAAAIYKRQAAEAAEPRQAASALQQLSNLYQSAHRYGDAAAVTQQAIGKAELSGDPNPSLWMGQNLASLFQQAGQNQAADEVYQQLIAQNPQLDVVTSYASFLESNQRFGQAEKVLTDYQAGHSDANPGEQTSLMMALANVERLSGKPQLAEEYQNRANAAQAQLMAQALPNSTAMQSAIVAANLGKMDEAFNLALQALDSVHSALELDQARPIAERLGVRQPAKADEIYRRSLALAGSLSVATVAPLVNLQKGYAGFLAGQGRLSEFDRTLENWTATLTAARGAGTGWLEGVLRSRVDPFRPPARLQDALTASRELVQLEESLSGDTSEPYLDAIQKLASAMEANGDRTGALPFRQKAVKIADLVYTSSFTRQNRGAVFGDAAIAFAYAGQFDEADALAARVIAISQQMPEPFSGMLTSQLQLISQLKQAAQQTTAARR